MPNLKVLYIIPSVTPMNGHSGSSTHIREIINGLRELGVKVTVLGGSSSTEVDGNRLSHIYKSSRRLPIPGFVRFFRRDLKSLWQSYRLARAGNRIILDERPDVIYERAEDFSLTGWWLGRKHNLPRVIEVNGIFYEEGALFNVRPFSTAFCRYFQSVATRSADCAVAISSELKRRLIVLDVSDEKIVVHQNGVSEKRKEVSSLSVSSLRQKLGLNDSIVLGFLGHILPYHRVDILIRTVAKLCDIGTLKILIVGPGRIVPELADLSRVLGVADKVIMTGQVKYEDVPVYISCMDICVIPGQSPYSSPVKLFEYGLFGKPIISAVTPAITEVWHPGIHGIGIRDGNLDDLAEAIRRYIAEPELQLIHGRAFQEKVLREHTWKHVSVRTLKLLNKVLKS